LRNTVQETLQRAAFHHRRVGAEGIDRAAAQAVVDRLIRFLRLPAFEEGLQLHEHEDRAVGVSGVPGFEAKGHKFALRHDLPALRQLHAEAPFIVLNGARHDGLSGGGVQLFGGCLGDSGGLKRAAFSVWLIIAHHGIQYGQRGVSFALHILSEIFHIAVVAHLHHQRQHQLIAVHHIMIAGRVEGFAADIVIYAGICAHIVIIPAFHIFPVHIVQVVYRVFEFFGPTVYRYIRHIAWGVHRHAKAHVLLPVSRFISGDSEGEALLIAAHRD